MIMNNIKRTICVIPAYNEEATIASVIKQSLQYVDDVLVVNDASTDKTLDIVQQTEAIVLSNETNLGYEISLKKGFNFAFQNNYDFLVFIDADGQHPCELLPMFLSQLSSGNNLVLGIREYLPRYSEKFASLLFSFFLHIKDPFCGMKGFDISLVDSKLILVDSKSFGLTFLYNYLRRGARFSQLKIPIYRRIYGQSRVGLNTVWLDFRLIRSCFSMLMKLSVHKSKQFVLHNL